jgi:2-polyprenyl-6-methoxyphenol hydroxylase-like FAD-dependent oxidoreductase/predicted DsbA family dithiol-disulfide isomerase
MMKNTQLLPVRLYWFTDPFCSTCWAFSPYLHKLELEFGHLLTIEYKMGGLLESWKTFRDNTGYVKGPGDLVVIWNKLGQQSGMSMDGDIWSEMPPDSSYPSSLAYHAVKKLAPEKARKYFRLLREELFLRKEDISSVTVQTRLAESLGIASDEFTNELNSQDNLDRFKADVRLKIKYGIDSLPCIIILDQKDQVIKIPIEDGYEQVVLELKKIFTIDSPKTHPQTIEGLLENYGLLSTKEVAVLLNRQEDLVFSELQNKLSKGEIESESYKYATFWKTVKKEKKLIPQPKQLTAIIGGGIAGLSLAIQLKKQGIRIKVYERASEFKNQGLGFLIMSNGFEIFRQMGLERQFLQKANAIQEVTLLNKDGRILENKKIDLCFGISRRNCITILRNELDPKDICYGSEINSITITDSLNQKLSFPDDSIPEPDLIIGCDGSHSKMRESLFPNSVPFQVEEKEIVCLIRDEELAKNMGHTFMKVVCPEMGFNMGMVPSGHGEVIWFIQINNSIWHCNDTTSGEMANIIKEISKSLPTLFRRAINRSDFRQTFLWEMYDMDLMPSFHKGRTLLIGDSAHPLLSFTSQGAGAALEDAACLSNLLLQNPDPKNLDELYSEFYRLRKGSIQNYIEGGRVLLDQFLNPKNYTHTHLPFLNYATK